MNQQDFAKLITTSEIAEEIIETSAMEEKTRSVFKKLLESAKNNSEDWNILVERLSGWLHNQSIKNSF